MRLQSAKHTGNYISRLPLFLHFVYNRFQITNWSLFTTSLVAMATKCLLLCLILLNLPSIYSLLVLFNFKPLDYRATLYNSNLQLTSALISLMKTYKRGPHFECT